MKVLEDPDFITKALFKKIQRHQKPPNLSRGDHRIDEERQIILETVRQAFTNNQLTEREAQVVLDQAGESLDPGTSVPDRILQEHFPSHPKFGLRGLVIRYYPPMGEAFLQVNDRMLEKLAEVKPPLADELKHRVNALRSFRAQTGPTLPKN